MKDTTSKFKIGDKVKLNGLRSFACLGNKVLTIIDVDCGHIYLPVKFEGWGGIYFPVKPCEIEKIYVRGQQLMFSFMGDVDSTQE